MQGSGNYTLSLEDSQSSVPHGWFQGLSFGSSFSLSLWHIPWAVPGHMISKAPSASASGWLFEPQTCNIPVWHHPMAQTLHNSCSPQIFLHGGDFHTADRGRKEGSEGRDGTGDHTMDRTYTIKNTKPVSNDIPIFTNCAPHPMSSTDSKTDCTKNLGSILGLPPCSPSTSHLVVLNQSFLLLQTLTIDYSFSFFLVYLLFFFFFWHP